MPWCWGRFRMAAGCRRKCGPACAGLKGLATLEQDVSTTIHTTFQLPSNFDAYLGSLNKRQKQNLRRDLNLFGKNFASKVDVVREGEELLREFAAFRQMHDRQWQAEKQARAL